MAYLADKKLDEVRLWLMGVTRREVGHGALLQLEFFGALGRLVVISTNRTTKTGKKDNFLVEITPCAVTESVRAEGDPTHPPPGHGHTCFTDSGSLESARDIRYSCITCECQ